MQPIKMVVIGDVHAHPHYDNKRFRALGQFCAEEQPDVIIQIGDWSDVCAFNSHGSKLELEQVRWKDDIAVTEDSLNEFMKPIWKRKRKMPRRIITLGNHENRINRWISQEPKFQGMMHTDDLGFPRFGFETFPYARRVEIAGFRFVHNIMTKRGMPCEIHSPTNGVKALGVSTVVGHSHTSRHVRHYFEDRKIHGIDLGCATHKDMGPEESWSNPTAHTYWRGVWVFDNAQNGDADFRQVRAETLGF